MNDTPVSALPSHPAAAEPVHVHEAPGDGDLLDGRPGREERDGGPEAGSRDHADNRDFEDDRRHEDGRHYDDDRDHLGPDPDPDPDPDLDDGPDRGPDVRAALDGAAAGLTATGLGLGIAVAPVLVAVLADAFGGGFTDPGDILRTSGQIWLAAQRVGLDVAGEQPGAAVRLGVVPLGLTIPLAVVLVRAGRRCAVAAGAQGGGARLATIALSACAAVYAALAYAVAILAGTPAIQPVCEHAPVAAGLSALVFGAYGAVRAHAYRDLPNRMPRQMRDRLRPFAAPARTAVRAGAVAACLLAAGGALIVVASLVTHTGAVNALLDRVAVGAPEAIALALLCAALMPNAVMCAVAYASCAGFAVGVGTSVSPTEVTLGAVPALPLLGALPEGTSVAGWFGLAVPVLAGVGAGLLAARGCAAGRFGAALGSAAASGTVTGLLAAGAAWLSTGAAGANRLTRIGPDVWATAGALTVEVAVVAMATAAVAGWWRWRGVRRAAQLETLVVAVPEQQDGH